MHERPGSATIILDKNFTKDLSRSCYLSLQLSPQLISCTIFSVKANEYIGFASMEISHESQEYAVSEGLSQFSAQAAWIGFPFLKTYILQQDHSSSLVPESLFDENNLRTYLEFNQAVGNTDVLRFDVLKNARTMNVYAVNESLLHQLEDVFDKPQLRHFSSVFIESIALNFKHLMDNGTVYLNVRKAWFDLLYFRDGKLHFYNLFRYKTKEDFIYFLLAALEQLELNPEEVSVVLMGYIDEYDRLHEILYRYIRHSEMIGRNETYRYARTMDGIKHHHYFVLYNLLQCV